MSRKTACAAALVLGGLAIGSSQGCASLIMTVAEPTPYGGLQADAKVLESTMKTPSPVLALLVLADMGASTVLDTAFLPITIPSAMAGSHRSLLSASR